MLWQHTRTNVSGVYCSICPCYTRCLVQPTQNFSPGLLTVTKAYVKGSSVSSSLTNMCPPAGYRWGFSTQQLPDIHHHFCLSLSQLLQHHHGGGLRRYAHLFRAIGQNSHYTQPVQGIYVNSKDDAMARAQPQTPNLSSAFLPSVISVTRPLDYEQVPNGMIYLTVMAKDGGNPALNSTVLVTVEVIVSITAKK